MGDQFARLQSINRYMVGPASIGSAIVSL